MREDILDLKGRWGVAGGIEFMFYVTTGGKMYSLLHKRFILRINLMPRLVR